MKSLLFIIPILLSVFNLHSQFDDKFYYPKKEWKTIPDSITYEEISFEIGEGQTISGLILEPQGEFRENIIFFHGAGGNVSTYLFMTLPLAERGYRIAMIDVRGYGKSTGTPTHVGIAEDAIPIFDWLTKQSVFEGSKPIIYGASMGTQIATHLASKVSGRIQLLVLDGPISSFTDIAAHSAPKLQKPMIKKFVTSPYSAVSDVPLVDVPVLIIHSPLDKDIPYEQAQAVFDAAKEPKVFWEYEGDHLMAAKLYGDDLVAEIRKIVVKH